MSGPEDDATIIGASSPGAGVADPRASLPEAGTPAVDVGELPPSGPNPLVCAAHPLLTLAASLRHALRVDDIPALWHQAAVGLRRFDARAAEAGIDARTVSTARYVLCALLDEAVLHSAWSAGSSWRGKTLLMAHHGDTYGGETFFVILDRLCADIERHVDLAELMYLCLSLGFGGRYLVEPGGALRLDERRDDLYRRIAAVRADVPMELSTAWQGLARPLKTGKRRIVCAVVVCLACLVASVGLHLRRDLRHARTAFGVRLSGVAHAPPPPIGRTASAPSEAPRRERGKDALRRALREEGVLDRIDVRDEAGGRALLRIAAGGSFASGAATLGTGPRDTLERLARALDRVPGAVVVVGHADDQPVRQSRFRDNNELSLARARNAAAILTTRLTDPSRVSVRGAGAARLVTRPTEGSDVRARQRRVDVLFIPEAE